MGSALSAEALRSFSTLLLWFSMLGLFEQINQVAVFLQRLLTFLHGFDFIAGEEGRGLPLPTCREEQQNLTL